MSSPNPIEVLRNFIHDDSRSVPAGAPELEAQAEADEALAALVSRLGPSVEDFCDQCERYGEEALGDG